MVDAPAGSALPIVVTPVTLHAGPDGPVSFTPPVPPGVTNEHEASMPGELQVGVTSQLPQLLTTQVEGLEQLVEIVANVSEVEQVPLLEMLVEQEQDRVSAIDEYHVP